MADYEARVQDYFGFGVGRFGFGVVDFDIRKFCLGCFVGASRAELVRFLLFGILARAAGSGWSKPNEMTVGSVVDIFKRSYISRWTQTYCTLFYESNPLRIGDTTVARNELCVNPIWQSHV